MATLAISALGAAIGGTVAPGIVAFGMTGASLGWTIGGLIGNALFPADQGNVQGPRLSDLKVQNSSYGGGIPVVYGSARVAGNVIWSTDLVEKSKTTGGGKGMGGGGPSQTTYSYTVSFAVALCEGEIAGVRRIWANKELVYDAGADSVTQIMANDLAASSITVYTGSESQLADPTIQADRGIDDTPAYRGLAYVVLKDLQLEKFGNRTPQLEFEVVRQGEFGIMRSLGNSDIDVPSPSYNEPPYSDSNDPFVYYGNNLETGDYLYAWTETWGTTPFMHNGSPLIGWREGNAIRVFCQITDTPARYYGNPCTEAASGHILDYYQGNLYSYLIDIETGQILSREKSASVFQSGQDFVGHYLPGAPASCWNMGVSVQISGMWLGGANPLEPIYNVLAFPAGNTYGICKVQGDPNGDAWGSDFCIQTAAPIGRVFGLWDYGQQEALYGQNINLNTVQRALVSAGFSENYVVGHTMSADMRRLYVFMSSDYATEGWANYSLSAWAALELNGDYSASVVDTGGFDGSWAFSGSASHAEAFRFFGNGGLHVSGNSAHIESNYSKLWIQNSGSVGYDAGIIYASLDTNNDWHVEYDGMPFSRGAADTPWMASIYAEANSAVICTQKYVYRLTANPSLTAGTIILGDIVADLCDKSGLQASEYDVAELTDAVDGYVIGQRMTARNAIEPLQMAYYFDGVESDKKLKFKKRGRSVSATFAEDDLAAHDGNPAELPDQLNRTRQQEMELPREISVSYFSKDGDYQEGTQYDRRLITSAVNVIGAPLPIVLTDEKAAQVASVNLYGAWQSRESFQWSSGREYALLDPADVALVNKGGLSWKVRITKRTEGANGVISWEGVKEDTTAYSQVGAYSITPAGMQTLFVPSSTSLKVLDTYSLRDSDSYNPSLYLAASGYGSNWKGAWLYESLDSGISYASSDEVLFEQASAIGVAQTALEEPDQFGFFDELSSVTVSLFDKSKTLDNATESQVLLGANSAYLGGEIIQFKNAELLGDGLYKLTGLLRGRKGSEKYASTHEIGDDFILLDSSAMEKESLTQALIGSQIFFKALSFGSTSLSSVPAKSVDFVAKNMQPLAPVFVNGYNDATGDWTINWVRRTRRGGEWIDGTDASIGEDSENYIVEIWDNTFTTLKRSIPSTTQSAIYTVADQTTDFGAVQEMLSVRIYQMSSVVGYGEPAQVYLYVGQAAINEKFYAVHDMLQRLNPQGLYTFENCGGILGGTNQVINMFPRGNDLAATGSFLLGAASVASDFRKLVDDKPCAYFSGDTAYMNAADSELNPSPTLGFSTISIFKPSSTQKSTAGIWCSCPTASSTTNQYILQQTAAAVSDITYKSASSTTQSSVAAAGALTADAWNLIGTTHAAGTAGTLTAAKVYKEGDLFASGTLHAPPAVSRTLNYVMNSHYSNEYAGYMSTFATFRRELTADEMRRVKAAYLFGARPTELAFASSRHSVSDRCGQSAKVASGVSVVKNTSLYGFNEYWMATGSAPLLEYESDSYYVGTEDFEFELLFYAGAVNQPGEWQCLVDFGSVPGSRTVFSDTYPEEFNQIVRNDGFCLSMGKMIVNPSYPNVTDSAFIIGANNAASTWSYSASSQYPIGAVEDTFYQLSVKRVSGTVSGEMRIAGNTSVVNQPSIVFSGEMTAKRFSLFNFNQEIGPGNWPFKGKLVSFRLWKGITFNKASYAAF